MKKLKIKIKGFLVLKIARYRKEIKAYKTKLTNNAIIEQGLIDKITLLENDIRDLLLKLPKEEKDNWLMERNKNERYFTKKK